MGTAGSDGGQGDLRGAAGVVVVGTGQGCSATLIAAAAQLRLSVYRTLFDTLIHLRCPRQGAKHDLAMLKSELRRRAAAAVGLAQ